MKIFLLLALVLCVHSEDVKKSSAESAQHKDKRQTQGEYVPSQFEYRTARKQEHVAPVQENQDDERDSRIETQEYRPGQVFSLNTQELLELQPERKAPLSNSQQLQQLYVNPQQEQKQNIQQFYYLEPQVARQVSLQPSHAVIARPDFSSNGGEASVGAALSVSDTGANAAAAYDQDLFSLLGQSARQEDTRPQVYPQPQQSPKIATQSVAPQYQQVDIPYVPKPSKKPTKLRSKAQISPPQSVAAPQQYLIETTNVQPQYQPQPQQQYQLQPQQQYQPQPQQQQYQPQQSYQLQQQPYRPIAQSQRVPQTLRYVQIQPTQATVQQSLYERPESQGLKVVPAPKLQQLNPQLNFRIIPQYQQEASPKQFRVIDQSRVGAARQEKPRIVNINERPVSYLKRFPDPTENQKLRTVLSSDSGVEGLASNQRLAQVGDQYYIRSVYRPSEQHARYDPSAFRTVEQQRSIEPTKPPQSSIYVSQNHVPKKVQRPLVRIDSVKVDQPIREQQFRIDASSSAEQINLGQQSQNIEEQRAHLPPPRNNKAYTPEEFAALVAAGYSVTPIPVGQAGSQAAQSRSSVDIAPPPQRRPGYGRRNQYLPLRVDDAP